CHAVHLDLRSLPTRRSSDLPRRPSSRSTGSCRSPCPMSCGMPARKPCSWVCSARTGSSRSSFATTGAALTSTIHWTTAVAGSACSGCRSGHPTSAGPSTSIPVPDAAPRCVCASPLRRPNMAAPDTIRILLCDDHHVLRAGLKALLENEEDFVVVGEASTGEEAIERCELLRPDVVVMDLSMPGMGGLEA